MNKEVPTRDRINQQIYETIYRQGQELLKYPDEILVSYLYTTVKKDPSIKKILDVGCGSGRHVVLFAREGFAASGIETSPSALVYAQKFLETEGLDADLKPGSCSQIDFADDAFDLLLCWGVINNVVENGELEKTMQELKRVLRKDGRLLISFMAPEDKKFKGAVLVEDNVYQINYKDSSYHTRFWNREESVAFLTKYNFETEKIGFVLRNVNFDEEIPVSYYTVAARNIK
ncbi:MAG: class I SAM-dependent methyltransferase [Deltaproteobacteria bacterium]|nr:class I SAM-dependent methyltransferase [Deltaproteobacteria bacterium]